ncbi:PQQ-dependent sugar dehydrogenase [Neotamlana sedimentorum]|uniref:PQQ-dependent sugar dehydrogenase n=1 Tax=Neotamlana sedimentorum TaxID=1435349 RepID=UPI00069B3655|nr:PQQ-dependent sugar dehydrogenase [Tamlana sedimentorum]
MACFLGFGLLSAQTPMTPLSSAVTSGSDWETNKITTDNALDYPWEITYGPDDKLWVTERVGEKIVRVDIATSTNTPTILIDLSSKVANAKQGGLMGMAIHPDLYADINTTINNYVFVSYTYNDGGQLKLRIARLLYNNTNGTLTEDTSLDANGTILEGVPGSEDHNSGRLIIGPDLKIYYTIGDQGANQFNYACNPVLSQVLPISSTDYDNYPGKTLRMNLDGSIPSDNPTLNSVKSHVYTYGHRNAQGIIFAANGTLYASEHGAKVDDEINIIKSGQNYGWPEIAGYYDNLAYTYCNWSSLGGSCNSGSFSDHNCPSGAETATEYESYPTAGDVPSNFEPPIGTYGSTTSVDPPGGWFTWPTVAPSGIDIHEAGSIPCWGTSLLIPTLKKGTIYRAQLNATGDDIINDAYEEFHSSNDRYRDIAISPDGLTIFAVTDNGGGTSGPSSDSGVSIANPGVIIKIEYVGPQVTEPLEAPTLEDVVSYCPITLTAPVVTNNASECEDITGTTTDPTTYSSGSHVVNWSFNDNGTIVNASQNVIINPLESPSNVIASPSSTTAEISWDALENVSFNLQYREQGSSTWLTESVATNTITLTGLTLSTTYEYQIQSDCGGSQSAFSTVDTFTTTAVTYCTPVVDFYPDDFYISNVTITADASGATLLNNSSNETNDVEGYSNHTAVAASDYKSTETFSISITLHNTHEWNKTTGHSVWIDYNQDGDFEDTDERVWGTTDGDDLFAHGAIAQGSFTIPITAATGNTRLRIASRTYWTGTDPCHLDFDGNNGGEFEDYTINITSSTLAGNDFALANLEMYPNPVKDVLYIKLPNNINYETISLDLVDIQGRLIKTTTAKGQLITISNFDTLNSGIYFVRFKNNAEFIGSKKLIKH